MTTFIEVHSLNDRPALLNVAEIGRVYPATTWVGSSTDGKELDHATIILCGAANEGDSRMFNVRESFDDIAHMLDAEQDRPIVTLEQVRQT